MAHSLADGGQVRLKLGRQSVEVIGKSFIDEQIHVDGLKKGMKEKQQKNALGPAGS